MRPMLHSVFLFYELRNDIGPCHQKMKKRLYKLSKEILPNNNDGHRIWQSIFQGGSLPFVVTAFLMALSSILIWRLDEPTHFVTVDSKGTEDGEYKSVGDSDIESGHHAGNALESFEDSENERPDGCCLALRETTYDLKLD